MIRGFILLCGAVLALGSSTVAQAGLITWTYDFTPTGSTVLGDSGKNQIDFSNQAPNTTTGSSDIVATNLTVHNAKSDTFTNENYAIRLKLTDGSASADVLFSGILNGKIVNGNPTLTNSFGPLPSPVVLNGDTFTFSGPSFVSPNPFNPNPDLVTKGAIGFHVSVDGASGQGGPPSQMPEPSTLLLSCLGMIGGGLGWRRRSVQA